jgi:PIN domain nuclease of toxin-antitoxin system
MTSVVLDASALLALVNGEKGHEQVASILEDAAMSTVNACEVIGELHTRLQMPIREAEGIVLSLVPHVIDFDWEQSMFAGALKRQTKTLGLSLGDRACLALGKKLSASVYTADSVWKSLDVSVNIVLIR